MRVPATAAGRRAKCPKCNNAFEIPPLEPLIPEGDPEPYGFDDGLLDELSEGSALETSPEQQAAQAEAYAAAAARQREIEQPVPATFSEPGRPGVDWGSFVGHFFGTLLSRDIIGRVCLVALFFGGVLIFLGVKEGRIRGRSSAEPQTISCEQLANAGPGDNLHVVMTEFMFLPSYVYEESLGTGGWNAAWVPAISLEAFDEALARELGVSVDQLADVSLSRMSKAAEAIDMERMSFNIIVSLPNASNEMYLSNVGDQDTLQGMVLNGFTSLDGDTRRLLKESYPSVDLQRCWILVHGRKPGAASAPLQYIGGGIALLLVGLGINGKRALDAARL